MQLVALVTAVTNFTYIDCMESYKGHALSKNNISVCSVLLCLYGFVLCYVPTLPDNLSNKLVLSHSQMLHDRSQASESMYTHVYFFVSRMSPNTVSCSILLNQLQSEVRMACCLNISINLPLPPHSLASWMTIVWYTNNFSLFTIRFDDITMARVELGCVAKLMCYRSCGCALFYTQKASSFSSTKIHI